jgi:sporulation protein YlmC with PRC-barrel domain
MDTSSQADQLFGYDVTDSQGTKLGSIDGVWLDHTTNRPKFLSIKTGRLPGNSYAVPIEQARIDEQDRTIQLPCDVDQIKSGPQFRYTKELSPEDEQAIYRYYGMQ